MEAIFKRRSIRKYTKDAVPDDEVRKLLEAAMAAPSAGNEQPWQFIVIRDPKVLARIPEVHPHAPMVPSAQVCILICGDMGLVKHEGFWVQDCAAATENLLIAAAHNHLGAVWLGVHPRQERVEGLQKLLGIPESIVPFALVPIGRPAEKKEAEDRYRPDRVHRDRWGG